MCYSIIQWLLIFISLCWQERGAGFYCFIWAAWPLHPFFSPCWYVYLQTFLLGRVTLIYKCIAFFSTYFLHSFVCVSLGNTNCTPCLDMLFKSYYVWLLAEACRSNHMFVATQELTSARSSIDYLFQGNPLPLALSSSLYFFTFPCLMQHHTGIGWRVCYGSLLRVSLCMVAFYDFFATVVKCCLLTLFIPEMLCNFMYQNKDMFKFMHSKCESGEFRI